MTKMRVPLLLALIAWGSPPAFAAEHVLLDEIVVRGKKESPREERLTIREVRESPARDMGEALKAVEGISFASGVKIPENGRNFHVTAAYRF